MLLSPNPLKGIKDVAKEGQAKTLNLEEHQDFLTFLDGKRHSIRNRAIYLLGYRAGLRVGTIAGLLLSDVVDAQGKVKNRAVARRAIMKGSKNSTLYLNHPELVEALQAWVDERPRSRVENLIVTQKGTAFSPNSLAHTLKRLFDEAGLEDCSSHSLRRSFATNLLRSGADIVALKTLLNHSSIQTTQRYVCHDEAVLAKLVTGS